MRATSLFATSVCVLLTASLVAAQSFDRVQKELQQYDRSVEEERARYGNPEQNVTPPRPAVSTGRANAPATPSAVNQMAPTNQAESAQRPDVWRYVYYQGQWWYFTPDRHWMFFSNNAWYGYDASVYGGRDP